jgi:hypothetical protein
MSFIVLRDGIFLMKFSKLNEKNWNFHKTGVISPIFLQNKS